MASLVGRKRARDADGAAVAERRDADRNVRAKRLADTVAVLRGENAHLRALVARLTADVERAARAMAWSRAALAAAGAVPPEPWVAVAR